MQVEILTETKEQRVHAHCIDAEKAVRNQVGTEYYCLLGKERTVKISEQATLPSQKNTEFINNKINIYNLYL